MYALVALTFALALAGCSRGGPGKPPPDPLAPVEPSESGNVAREFTFPDYDQQNRLKSLIIGREANFELGSPEVQIRGLRVETYGDDGKLDMVVEAPECTFDRDRRIASSAGEMEMQTSDGQFSISGKGFEWRQAEGELVISNQVHMQIQRTLLGPVTPES